MPTLKPVFSFGVLAFISVVGCDKNQSTPPGMPPAGVTPAGTVAPTPAAVTAMAELAGTYHAVSEVTGEPSSKRHQTLKLGSDGTVELDTTVVDSAKPAAPKSGDVATGTYTAGPKKIVATFTLKDGKPIAPTNDKRVMNLDRERGDKSLTSDDGRTFERAANP